MFLILSLPLSPLCYSRFWLLSPSELTFAPSLGLIVNYHRMLSRSCVIYSLTLFIHLHYPCSRILQYRIFSVLFFIISNINYVPVLSVLCNGSSCVFFFIVRVFGSREILAISLFVLPLSHLVSALFLFVLSLSYSRRVPFHFHYWGIESSLCFVLRFMVGSVYFYCPLSEHVTSTP